MHGKHPIFATSLHKHSAKKAFFCLVTAVALVFNGQCVAIVAQQVEKQTTKPKSNELVQISGTILDDKNSPIPLVNIVLVDSNPPVGTTSNADGIFSMKVPNNDAKLQISSVGFETKTVSVADIQENPNIQLKAQAVILSETEVEGKTPCSDSGGDLNGQGICICPSEKFLTEYKNDEGDSACKCIDTEKYEFDEKEKTCKVKTNGDNGDNGGDNGGGAGNETTTPPTTTPNSTTSSKEDAAKKLADAREKYNKAQGAEQSFANRAVTAGATAATGLGAMQLAEGVAEQNADRAAETDMNAYIETMKCSFGKGQQVTLGNQDVTLPGGNELLDLYTEYKQTAERLKTTKKALGLRAGIENEVLYDKAQTGLYQYANTGKTGGGYTSLYNALTDETGDDAAAWASQKDISAQKKKAGAIAVVVGTALGIGGNLLVNEYEWGDDDDNDDPSLSQTQRQQKKTCRRGGGTWDVTNGCQCSADAGLTLTADKTTCECSETGYKYNKGTKRCSKPTDTNKYDIDVTKDGTDWAGLNEDGACMQKGKVINTQNGKCAGILSTEGRWWAKFSYSWLSNAVFYGESRCDKQDDTKVGCFCKPTRIVSDPIYRIDATNEIKVKDYDGSNAEMLCNTNCAHECAQSFATSQDLRKQALEPILRN